MYGAAAHRDDGSQRSLGQSRNHVDGGVEATQGGQVKEVHPVCRTLRDLRHAAGLSLVSAERRFGISGIVLGSYERGDRNPPLTKIEQILNVYGYTLAAIPKDDLAIRLPRDVAAELRLIADHFDRIAGAEPSEPPAYAA